MGMSHTMVALLAWLPGMLEGMKGGISKPTVGKAGGRVGRSERSGIRRPHVIIRPMSRSSRRPWQLLSW